jgi:Na+-transporting NADH:ubiquinone oxidoreductase subunit NqrB
VGLSLYGGVTLDFFPDPIVLPILITLGLCIQFLACQAWSVRFDGRGILISALSLNLLLRADGLEPFVWAIFLTVLGKFILRNRSGHFFNPTNFTIVIVTLTFSNSSWISGGQWGHGLLFCALTAIAGMIVTTGVKRWDMSLSTLAGWGVVQGAMAGFYGDPMDIALHNMVNGSLLIFCFFMISDPKTSPATFRHRLLFAGITCVIGGVVQFGFHKPHGLFYGLFLTSVLRQVWHYLSAGMPVKIRIAERELG